MQRAKFKLVDVFKQIQVNNVVISCRLPKVHHHILCHVQQHTHGSYRYSVWQTHPAGHTVGNTVAHPAGYTVGRLVCLIHKPLGHQSLLPWAQMVEHLVEFHEEVSA